MAAGLGLYHARLRDVPLQWPGAATVEELYHARGGGRAPPGRGS